jgi:hypothetical protein
VPNVCPSYLHFLRLPALPSALTHQASQFRAQTILCLPQDYKPSDYRALKRKVAQLLTVKRERELAAGVDRRASKSAER